MRGGVGGRKKVYSEDSRCSDKGNSPHASMRKPLCPSAKRGLLSAPQPMSVEASGKKDNIAPFHSALRQQESELPTNTIPGMYDHY